MNRSNMLIGKNQLEDVDIEIFSLAIVGDMIFIHSSIQHGRNHQPFIWMLCDDGGILFILAESTWVDRVDDDDLQIVKTINYNEKN